MFRLLVQFRTLLFAFTIVIAQVFLSISSIAYATPANPPVLLNPTTDGLAPNSPSAVVKVSNDGRYFAFSSAATNLVSGDTNGKTDFFIRDTVNGTTQRLDPTALNVSGVGVAIANTSGAYNFDISNDGRYLVFAGYPTSGSNANWPTVYLYDLQTNTTSIVYQILFASPITNFKISGDGNWIAYEVPTSSSGYEIDVKNRSTGQTYVVNQPLSGNLDVSSVLQGINFDGSAVVYTSLSNNNVPNDTNATNIADVFVWKRSTNSKVIADVSSTGQQSTSSATNVSMSADGNKVLFMSTSNNLSPLASGTAAKLYLHDFNTNTTSLTGLSPINGKSNNINNPVLTSDGNSVVFYSGGAAGNWVVNNTNTGSDAYLLDLRSNQASRLSTGGVFTGNYSVSAPIVGGDGRFTVIPLGVNLYLLDRYPDNLVPVVTGTPDRSPDFGSWYNHSVNITWSTASPDPNAGALSVPPLTLANVDGNPTVLTSSQSCDSLNRCAAGTVFLPIDKTPPTMGNIGPQAILLGSTSLKLSAPATDTMSGVAAAEYFIGSDPGVGNATPMPFSVNAYTVSGFGSNLQVGAYTYGMRAKDAAGNWSATRTYSLSVLPPAPTNFKVDANPSNQPTFTWDSVPGADYYYLTENNGSIIIATTTGTSVTATHTLQQQLNGVMEGTHTYQVIPVNNAVGQGARTANLPVTVDNTAPTINYTVNGNSSVLPWYNADATVSFSCFDTSPGIATCTSPITLTTEGLNQSVTGTAVDKAGNTTSVTTSGINIDKTVPVVSSVSWTNNPNSDGTASVLSFDASDNLSGVAQAEYFVGDTDPGIGHATLMNHDASLTHFNASFSGLAVGSYAIHYRVKDVAGNWSADATTILNIQVDAPANPTVSSSFSASDPTVNWDAVTGATGYNVYRDSVLVASVAAAPYVDTAATDGAHTYTVTATASGGESAPCPPVTAVVDTTAPTTTDAHWLNTGTSSDGNAQLVVPASDTTSGVVSGEYYFGDSDPGFGNGTPLSIFLNLPCDPNTQNCNPCDQSTQDCGSPCDPSSGTCTGTPCDPNVTTCENNGGDGCKCSNNGGTGNNITLYADLTGLAPGVYTIHYRVKDAAGNWSDTKTITLTVLPGVPTDLTVDKNPTNTSPVLSWTGVNGVTDYNVYRDGALLEPHTGTTYTDSTAAEGTHSYYVTAIRQGAEGGQSNSVSVVVDKTAPVLGTATWSANPIYVGQSSTLNIPFTDNLSGLTRGEYYVGTDPGQGNGTAFTVSGTNLTADIANLPVGSDTVHYRAVDNAGNWTDDQTVTIAVQPFTPTDLTVDKNPTNTNPVLTWSAVGTPDNFNVYRNDVLIGTSAGSTTTFTDATAQDGQLTYKVTAVKDGVESPASNEAVTTLDRLNPTVITATTPTGPNAYGWYNTDVTVNFTCTDTQTGITSCTSPITLTTEGVGQTVTGGGTDGAGNTTNVTTAPINIDKTAPVLGTANFAPDTIVKGDSTTLKIPASDNLSGVAYGEYNLDGGGATMMPYADGNFTTTFGSLPAGNHTVVYRAHDYADNWTSDSSINVAVRLPAPTGIGGKTPTNSAPAIGWDAVEVADHYAVYRNGVPIGTTTGTSYIDAVSPPGSYDYSVRAVTADGVQSDSSPTVTITYDVTPPTIDNISISGFGTISTPGHKVVMLQHNADVNVTVGVSGTDVAGGEYFVDTDPGVGNGTAMTYNSSDRTLNGTLSGSGLSHGNHLLYVRAEDTASNWSSPSSITFFYP